MHHIGAKVSVFLWLASGDYQDFAAPTPPDYMQEDKVSGLWLVACGLLLAFTSPMTESCLSKRAVPGCPA